MSIKKASVLGTGVLPVQCAAALIRQGIPAVIYDMDEEPAGFLERKAGSQGIPYEHPDPRELFRALADEKEKILVVSAINPYILPGYMLANPNLTAINCHQALLPRHPGRNAEMWAIYEMDEKTGITWHILTPQVDGGAILLQKELLLTPKHTSYQVFREQIRLAGEAFEELLPELLAGTAKQQIQPASERRKLHHSGAVPNEGFLDVSWEAEQISAFLRAMDYSILDVMPKPRIRVEDREYSIRKYKILNEQRTDNGISEEDGVILFRKNGILFQLTVSR